MPTTLEIKLQADVSQLRQALAQARSEIKQLGGAAKESGEQASKGFDKASAGAANTQVRVAAAYKTLDTVPDAAINAKIKSIGQAYEDLAASGTASSAELARAQAQMAQMVGALEAYRDGAEIDPAAQQQGANAAAESVRGVMAALKAEIAAAFAALAETAKENGTASFGLLAIGLRKLAGSVGIFDNAASQAAAGLISRLAGMAALLAQLGAAFIVLRQVSGIWADALAGSLDATSAKTIEQINRLRSLQGEIEKATLAQAQLMDRVAQATGTSSSTLSQANNIGATLNNTEGLADYTGLNANLPQPELIQKAAAALNQYTEGLDRNNAAKALGITNTAEFLRYAKEMTAEAQVQKQTMQELGLTISKEYADELEHAAGVMRRVKQANEDFFGSIKTAWSDAVRPVTVELAEMFSGVIPSAVAAARGAIAGLMAIWYTGAGSLVSAMIAVEQAVLGVGDGLKTLGQVALKTFSGDFAGAASAFSAGLDKMKARAKFTGGEIANVFEGAAKKLQNIMDGPARGQTVAQASQAAKGKKFDFTPPKAKDAKNTGGSESDQAKQLADAQYAFAKARLEAEQKLLEDSLKDSLAAYDSAYKEGLIGLEGYYTARESIERERLSKILQIRQAELAAAQAREAEAAKRKDEPARLRAAAEVVKLQAEVELSKNAVDKLSAQIETAKTTDAKLLESLKLKAEIELSQLQGIKLDRATIEADLRGQMEGLFKQFKSNQEVTATLEKIVTLKADTTLFDQRMAELEIEQRKGTQPLDNQAANINSQRSRGQISGASAQSQLEAVNAAKSNELQKSLSQLQAEYDKLGDSGENAKKKLDLADKINGLSASIANLKPAVFDIGVAFEDSLAANAESAFEAMINGTKSASQAFSDMAKAIISDIVKMIAKMLVMKAVKALMGGFADGGAVQAVQAFASGGRVTGPGGSRDDVIPAWLSNGEHVIDARTVSQFGGHAFFNALRAIGQTGSSERAANRISGTLSGLGMAIAGAAQQPTARGLRLADGGAVASVSSARSQATSLVQHFHISGAADQRTQSQMGAAAFNGANRAFRRNG